MDGAVRCDAGDACRAKTAADETRLLRRAIAGALCRLGAPCRRGGTSRGRARAGVHRPPPAGAGAGVVLAASEAVSVQLNLNLMYMFPDTGFVIQPSLGGAMAF